MSIFCLAVNFQNYGKEIIVGLIVSGTIWVMGKLYFRFLNRHPKITPLIGKYIGYYFIKGDQLLLEQNITIEVTWYFRFKITIVEKSDAEYKYIGYLYFEDDRLFGFLKGVKHPARSFISMMYPFNRGEIVQSLNGIFAGITQEKHPAAVKVHWTRHAKLEGDIRREFDDKAPKLVIVKQDTTENNLVKDINPILKK